MSVADGIPGILPELRAFSRSLLRRREDADDLLQDSVLLAIRAERTFDGQNLRAWMFTIMRNRAVNKVRKKAYDAGMQEVVSVSSCGVWLGERPASPDSGILFREVRTALASMEPEKRDIIMARGHDGLSYKEMADEIGHPIGTVMSRLHRAKLAFVEAMS